jgi:hypothetical protein
VSWNHARLVDTGLDYLSRGIGELQRRIIEAVERRGKLSAADVAWMLSPSTQASPTRSLRENVRRACASLVEAGYLSARKKNTPGSSRVFYYPPGANLDDEQYQLRSAPYQAEGGSVTKAALLRRGWTRTAIVRILGEPDRRIIRRDHRRDRPECRYDIQRVLKAEEDKESRFRFRKAQANGMKLVKETINQPKLSHFEDRRIAPDELTPQRHILLRNLMEDANT